MENSKGARIWTLRFLAPFALAFLLLGLIVLRSIDPAIISSLRGSGFDTLQRLWPREVVDQQPVRVVDIDEASLPNWDNGRGHAPSLPS